MWRPATALLALALAAPAAPAAPGPRVPPTRGEVWPRPLNHQKLPAFYTYDPNVFQIVTKGKSCNLLESAIERYLQVLRSQYSIMLRLRDKAGTREGAGEGARGADYQGNILALEVDLRQLCEEYPHADMDEAYGLKVSRRSTLVSDSVWGALRGLETFAQLFYITSDYQDYVVNGSTTSDYPRYSHRGLLVDTARHYLPVRDLELVVDALAVHKMNVLHWHLVDDQSFPYVSQRFPELSARGSFAPWLVYSAADIRRVVEHARARGVRVIAELDVPGHTLSWGVSHPELLAHCGAAAAARRGPLHPLQPAVYSTLAALLQELQALFPDHAFHLGGDEVDLDCWEKNPELIEYMRVHGMRSARELHALFMTHALRLLAPRAAPVVWQVSTRELHALFMTHALRLLAPRAAPVVWQVSTRELHALFMTHALRLLAPRAAPVVWQVSTRELHALFMTHALRLLAPRAAPVVWQVSTCELHALFMTHALRLLAPRAAPVVWQEVFDEGVPLSNKTIVQVWKFTNDTVWGKEMLDIIRSGQRVLFSSAWYLDALGLSWQAMYSVDPRRLVAVAARARGAGVRGAATLAERVLGGEAAMWGEMVDTSNIMTRIWPRASAVAEVLWSEPPPAGAGGTGGAGGAAARLEEHACRLRRRGVPAEPPNGPGFCALD
ncbi:unnamed protein product [Plutella xylostella]|uniref:Beta-hexosaminidase n=1 Tax=Plutella xylostella TaxID=51655 RepID=A0A8S4G8D8_PLUXY|nr:unnamed protein product [Plutella xylostella]